MGRQSDLTACPNREELWALLDVGFQVERGMAVGVVGHNGAGKTTLATLVCRMYDPIEGAVCVDGVDLRAFDIASWRLQIAAVFQDFVRYELPLRTNVAPAGAEDVDVVAALEAARAGNVAGLSTILSRALPAKFVAFACNTPAADCTAGLSDRPLVTRRICS